MTSTEKRLATLAAKKIRAADRKAERARQIEALRQIRDDITTSPELRLRAVELLHEMEAGR